MFGFLKKMLKGDNRPAADNADYIAQRKILESGDATSLRQLAADPAAHPEILYFLAKSEDAQVRRCVARNAATPVQAATLLANDRSIDVREALAARLVALLPDLPADKHSQLYAYAVQALGMLAQDEVFSLRRALSTALKDYAKAPPAVVSRLARDIEREVSEPILRFCVALPDADLLQILADHPAPWAIAAIAGRDKVSAPVAEAVVDTDDVPATTVLVNNMGADLNDATLQKIIDRARDFPEWHQPVAARKELSFTFARKLAGFVDETVLAMLARKAEFDAPTQAHIAAVVKRRMEYLRRDLPDETPENKVRRYATAQKLTPDVLQDALAWQDKDFVILSLAQLSGIHVQIVRKMTGLGAPKPVVALCHKAGVPMRLCVDIQKQLCGIPAQEVIYAKGGTDYPMTAEEIKWQLEFFGVTP